jgi:hypothetical protein
VRKAKREIMKQINILFKPFRPREKRSRAPPKEDKKKEDKKKEKEKKEKEKKEKEKKESKKSPRELKQPAGGRGRGGDGSGSRGGRGRGGRGKRAAGGAADAARTPPSSFESRVRAATEQGSSSRKRARRDDDYHGTGPPPIHSVLSLQTAKLMPDILGAAERARTAVNDMRAESFIGPVRIGLGGRLSIRVQHGGPDVEVGDIVACATSAHLVPIRERGRDGVTSGPYGVNGAKFFPSNPVYTLEGSRADPAAAPGDEDPQLLGDDEDAGYRDTDTKAYCESLRRFTSGIGGKPQPHAHSAAQRACAHKQKAPASAPAPAPACSSICSHSCLRLRFESLGSHGHW